MGSTDAQALWLSPSSLLIHRHRLYSRSLNYEHKFPTVVTRSSKLPTMLLRTEPRRLTSNVPNVREKLWAITPQPLKDFPFQKAVEIFLQQLLIAGKKALKRALFVLYIWSFISDVLYSISRNKDISIPLGLFVGCIVTDFSTEISKELFPFLEENDLRQHFVVSSCLFALTKIISTCFMFRGRLFLLHISNGGLMQVLWLWKNYRIKEKVGNSIGSSTDSMA